MKKILHCIEIVILCNLFVFCNSNKNSEGSISPKDKSNQIKEIYIYRVLNNMSGENISYNISPSVYYIVKEKKIYKVKGYYDEDMNPRNDTLSKTNLEKNISNYSIPVKHQKEFEMFGLDNDGDKYGMTITLDSGKEIGWQLTMLNKDIVPDELKPLIGEIEKGIHILGDL